MSDSSWNKAIEEVFQRSSLTDLILLRVGNSNQDDVDIVMPVLVSPRQNAVTSLCNFLHKHPQRPAETRTFACRITPLPGSHDAVTTVTLRSGETISLQMHLSFDHLEV